MTLRYASGTGVGLARGDVVVMLPSAPEPGVVGRLWEALDPADGAEPGVLDALGVLTSDAGAALTKLPPFALVAVRSGQVHALVRGACAVVVETAEGLAVTIDGSGVSTWSERLVPDVVGLAVRIDGERELLAVGGTWPLESGVVAASALGLRLTRAVPAAVVPPAPVSAVPPPPPAPAPAPAPTPAPTRELEPEPREIEPAAPAAPDETYGHLWGSTVLRGVEDAAVRVDDEDDEPAPAPPEPAPTLIAGVPTWTAQAPVPEQTMPPEQTGVGVPAEPPQGDDLDHDGDTVLTSALADLRSAAAAVDVEQQSAPRGPRILARTCPQGHVNSPNRDACRVCGQPLEADAALADRPVLGRMRVATNGQAGHDVDLDRPVVVGRRPRAPRTDGTDARLVTVESPSQDISRSHVEVRLDGWHVLVADLATTNGTMLLRAGQPPLRLHPNEGVLVVDGDVVDLGDGVTLSFEGVW